MIIAEFIGETLAMKIYEDKNHHNHKHQYIPDDSNVKFSSSLLATIKMSRL
jgi:hypothetical protein